MRIKTKENLVSYNIIERVLQQNVKLIAFLACTKMFLKSFDFIYFTTVENKSSFNSIFIAVGTQVTWRIQKVYTCWKHDFQRNNRNVKHLKFQWYIQVVPILYIFFSSFTYIRNLSKPSVICTDQEIQ